MAYNIMIPLDLLVMCLFLPIYEGAFSTHDKVLLRDISVLTLYHGRMTTARRSSPIPQLKCLGGTAGCSAYVPKVVQCYNKGSDGIDVQWECKTDMDNAYRFGEIEVSCEGYDYPDDPFVLKGSCGLEYTLDLTKEGYQHKNHHSSHHSYYQEEPSYHSNHQAHHSYSHRPKWHNWMGDLVTLAIVGIIIYALYKTCLAPSIEEGTSDNTQWRSRRPPPAGFRSEYMPGNDDGPSCSSQYNSYGSSTFTGTHQRPRAGGFWTGAATGGLLGYLMGSRTNTGYYQQPYHRPHTTWGSGWGSNWGTTGGSGWGSSSGSTFTSGSMFGSSGSTGTRTASGFGGTKRR